jgi:hypothetical protein
MQKRYRSEGRQGREGRGHRSICRGYHALREEGVLKKSSDVEAEIVLMVPHQMCTN